MWVSMYWYEFAQVQHCKKKNIIIEKKTETTTARGFHPHWISTLNLCVHVCFLCLMVYSVLLHFLISYSCTHYRSIDDKLTKLQILLVYVGFTNYSSMYTLVHFTEVAYINMFGK